MPDEPASAATIPGLEELSGSLLLDDPSLVLDDPTVVQLAAQPAPPAVEPAHAPPPAAHRALLGLPELPRSTPGPALDGSAMALPPTKATLRPPMSAPVAQPMAPDTEPHPFPTSATSPAADATDGVPPPPEHMFEALHGFEAAQGFDAVPAGPDADGTAQFEAAPSASTAPVQGDVEVTALPRGGLVAASDAMKRVVGSLKAALAESTSATEPRRRWFLPAIALAGLLVGVAVVALIVSLTRKGGDENDARTEPTASSSPSPSATGEGSQLAPIASAGLVAAPVAPAPPIETVASTTPCKVAGKPRVLAPSALVVAGIEVRAVGSDVALGFSPNEHQATALRIEPGTLSSSTVDAQSADPVRRVVPLASADGSLTIAADAERDGDALQGRRTVPLDPPIEVGAAGGNLVWAHPGGPAAGTLWPLEGEGNVEALRGATELGTPTATAIALRHAGAIWMGAATGRNALSPQGGLSRAGGAGVAVGSPAVAINDGVVVVAWADRSGPTDPWRLRWVRFKAGETPGEPGTFTPPAGGKGEQAMSPGLAAVPGGRFLLVWTEGPATRHDVRALTLSREGQPLGKPLDISRKSVNAGQGQAAITAARQGLVAFLESADGGFQVVATPIACGP